MPSCPGSARCPAGSARRAGSAGTRLALAAHAVGQFGRNRALPIIHYWRCAAGPPERRTEPPVLWHAQRSARDPAVSAALNPSSTKYSPSHTAALLRETPGSCRERSAGPLAVCGRVVGQIWAGQLQGGPWRLGVAASDPGPLPLSGAFAQVAVVSGAAGGSEAILTTCSARLPPRTSVLMPAEAQPVRACHAARRRWHPAWRITGPLAPSLTPSARRAFGWR